MEKILVLILACTSFNAQSFSSKQDTLNRRSDLVLEIRYLNQTLTAGILKKANPAPGEVLLFHLILSDSTKDTILFAVGKTHIIFIVNDT